MEQHSVVRSRKKRSLAFYCFLFGIFIRTCFYSVFLKTQKSNDYLSLQIGSLPVNKNRMILEDNNYSKSTNTEYYNVFIN